MNDSGDGRGQRDQNRQRGPTNQRSTANQYGQVNQGSQIGFDNVTVAYTPSAYAILSEQLDRTNSQPHRPHLNECSSIDPQLLSSNEKHQSAYQPLHHQLG